MYYEKHHLLLGYSTPSLVVIENPRATVYALSYVEIVKPVRVRGRQTHGFYLQV